MENIKVLLNQRKQNVDPATIEKPKVVGVSEPPNSVDVLLSKKQKQREVYVA